MITKEQAQRDFYIKCLLDYRRKRILKTTLIVVFVAIIVLVCLTFFHIIPDTVVSLHTIIKIYALISIILICLFALIMKKPIIHIRQTLQIIKKEAETNLLQKREMLETKNKWLDGIIYMFPNGIPDAEANKIFNIGIEDYEKLEESILQLELKIELIGDV